MKALKIHGAMDLRIEDFHLEELTPNQVQISVAMGGICGTDLHYYKHGGFGQIKLREPMVLGHEVSGHISKLGSKVTNLAIGQLVSVSPSRPCNNCEFCLKGSQNHCLNMQFYGSAMPFPHIQGAFRETLIAEDYQCIPADGLSAGEAAMAEPLAVCLHAINQAGNIFGKKILITGSGPIGTLCVLSARRAGAEKIVVTDISDNVLDFSNSVGADMIINTLTNYDQLEQFQVGKGAFDFAIECSGSASGINDAIKSLKPKGTLIQLGLGGDILMPLVAVTTKELNIKGSFRFHSEFQLAVKMMQKKLIDVNPLITHKIPFKDAEKGFHIAMDEKENSMKVHLAF
ncbi:L-idonate 5-dehydrogenase [Pseudomonadota bacterium]|nr:L-idonate 5-dehydrogenase [Alphaproteobacteria bacterium]MDC1356168.1 L-idonate 5-dehydrogenase [Pseudomonadota bacterium]